MNAIQIDRPEEDFEDFLRDMYPEVDICGISCDAVDALKVVDETSFNTMYNDWNSKDENKLWECTKCDATFTDEEDAQECCEDINNEEFDRQFMNSFERHKTAYLYEITNHNEMDATYRTAYSMMLDGYQKDGLVSERQADNFTFNGEWD